MGITAGLNHDFYAFDVKTLNTLSITDGPTSTFMLPELGIYYGMEKKLSDKFSFGFDSRINWHKIGSSVTIKDNSNGCSYDYSFRKTSINGNEGVYLAYSLMDDLQLNFGIGLDLAIRYGGSSEVTPAAGAPSCQLGDGQGFNLGIGMGAVLDAGITYYLNDIFFVKGDLVYHSSPFFSSEKNSENFNSGWSSSSDKIQAQYYGQANLSLLATIGFKW